MSTIDLKFILQDCGGDIQAAQKRIEQYADPAKWKVGEPMKSLGWTPAEIARAALSPQERGDG